MTRRCLVVFAIAIASAGCGRNATARAQLEPPPVTVGPEDIAVVQRKEIKRGPVLSGRLVPERQATVRSEVGGAVLETRANPGETVKQGQPLARIDESAIRAQVASGHTATMTASHAVDVTQREVERQRALVQAGAVAERDLEAAEQSLANAEAQLASAVAQVAAAEEQLERTRVRAPLTGTISERPVNAGDVVQPGAPLFTIVDPSSMNLEATIPAPQIGQVRVGAHVSFEVAGHEGRMFDGRIDRINPAADPATGQVRVYVNLPNGDRNLVAGLFAQGRVATESHVGLVVPASAIATNAGTATIAVVRNGVVERQPVKPGLRDELTEEVELNGPVHEGDIVLLGAAQSLTPGTAVRTAAPGANPPPAATTGRR